MSWFFIKIFYPSFIRLAYVACRILPNSTWGRWYREDRTIINKVLWPENEGDQRQKILCCCSSLGEFETVSPIIQKLKLVKPSPRISIQLFSTSAIDSIIQKGYFVHLSPFELNSNVNEYLKTTMPDLVIIADNSIWPVFMEGLLRFKIPYIFASCYYNNRSFFHKAYLGSIKKYLIRANAIFTPSKVGLETLNRLRVPDVRVVGNPRVEGILKSAEEHFDHASIQQFIADGNILVCGSTHESDEIILARCLKLLPRLKLIIVPHNVNKDSISRLTNRFPDHILFSSPRSENSRVLILDRQGLLKYIYRFGHYAYVGGGFDRGIHNIWEALVYRKMVLFGPRYNRFPEAEEAIQKGIGFCVNSSLEMANKIINFHWSKDKGNALEAMIQQQKNAVSEITAEVRTILKKRL